MIKEGKIKEDDMILIHGNKKSLIFNFGNVLQSKDDKVQGVTIKYFIYDETVVIHWLLISNFYAVEPNSTNKRRPSTKIFWWQEKFVILRHNKLPWFVWIFVLLLQYVCIYL